MKKARSVRAGFFVFRAITVKELFSIPDPYRQATRPLVPAAWRCCTTAHRCDPKAGRGRQRLGALLHEGADVGPGMGVGAHGGKGEAVDYFVGAGLDDGKLDAPLEDDAALGGGMTPAPAFGADLGPVVGYWGYLPAFEGIPPAVFEVVGVEALAGSVEAKRQVTGWSDIRLPEIQG
ncbi:hypothetical protein CSV86_022530 [Pseudomonas putida CSV86]|uniref:Uncharacterized protein n=1 Tax=Pseudomonas bharatica CSV86 TaxID=1005395 RepID=A0A7K4EJE2_9PSED|nr:hypothetical protein [Pseudomonas bharatica CSV86]